jgi:hypothetical protein
MPKGDVSGHVWETASKMHAPVYRDDVIATKTDSTERCGHRLKLAKRGVGGGAGIVMRHTNEEGTGSKKHDDSDEKRESSSPGSWRHIDGPNEKELSHRWR